MKLYRSVCVKGVHDQNGVGRVKGIDLQHNIRLTGIYSIKDNSFYIIEDIMIDFNE